MRYRVPFRICVSGLCVLVSGTIAACAREASKSADTARNVDSTASFASTPPGTLDASRASPQEGCKVPLTGLLETKADGSWSVSWEGILAHVATLTVDEERGEKDHVLKPTNPVGPVIKASIAGIKGTATLSLERAIQELRCGRVIARIVSDGDHSATQIYRDTNWLVIAKVDPVASSATPWIFVTLNPKENKRESLPQFKYTPHYAAAPEWFGIVRPLSPAARGCQKRGLNACFIDPERVAKASIFGALFDFDGLGRFPPGGGSEPWVSCPSYGCCCGGTKCHT